MENTEGLRCHDYNKHQSWHFFPELSSYLNKLSFVESSHYAHKPQLISLVQAQEPNFVCKSALILTE